MKKYTVLILTLLLIFVAAMIYSCAGKPDKPDDNAQNESMDNNSSSTESTENIKGEDVIATTSNQSNKKMIKSPKVYSIKSPVAGNYPQGLFKYPNQQNTNSSGTFTQTLEWIPEIKKVFATDTQYTAVLTLTPASSKDTFDGVQISDIKGLPVNNVADISFEIIDDSMIIKIVFEKTAPENAEPELLFYDEFDGNKLDYAKWDYCPNWDRQGRSTWDDDLVSVGDGYLHLKFVRDKDFGERKTSDSKLSKNWIRAGAIRTMEQNNIDIIFENTFGYYEASIKFPVVRGMWGAFWLMSPTQWILTEKGGAIGTEIDIVESIWNEQGKYNAAMHWDGYGNQHKGVGSDKLAPGINIYDGEFHVFAMDWSPSEYIFYVDGVEYWRSDGGSKFNNSGINQNPNYIKLTLEGADWAGNLPADFTEGEMLVDYVKVYNQPR